jgi:hypothetical protein
MTQTQPSSINQNLLSEIQFYFNIQRLPKTTFYGQGINLPGISLPSVVHPNPFTNVKRGGDKITWEPLTVQFKVDEDFTNWQEIFDWMTGVGFPSSFTQYQNAKTTTSSIDPKGSIFSDGFITLQNNKNVDNVRINFQGLIPTALSGIDFDITKSTVDYINATATFEYTLYTIESL